MTLLIKSILVIFACETHLSSFSGELGAVLVVRAKGLFLYVNVRFHSLKSAAVLIKGFVGNNQYKQASYPALSYNSTLPI
jgi:hypothetical protein